MICVHKELSNEQLWNPGGHQVLEVRSAKQRQEIESSGFQRAPEIRQKGGDGEG